MKSDAAYVIGIDLGGTKMAGAVTNLSGQVLASLNEPTRASAGPEAVFENLLAFTQRLWEKAKIEQDRIAGVGIGIPGVVDKQTVVRWAPSLNWKDVPLVAQLRARLDVPIWLENDVNLQALGEYWYGLGRGVNVLVHLAIGTGLGAGIVLNGQLFFGAHQAAGEVGNLVADVGQLGRRYPGFGFMESVVSGTGIAQRFLELSGNEDKLDAQNVFALAREGDAIARQVVTDFTEHLALVIVGLSTVLDPELIILGGGVARDADLFLPHLKELAFPVLQAQPRIAVSELRERAGIMGAVALTLHNKGDET